MGCFVFLAAFFSARLALFLTWVFKNEKLSAAFTSGWIPILGFFLLPWTTLAWTWTYSVAKGGPDGFGIFLVIIAFLADLASYGSGDRERRRRARD